MERMLKPWGLPSGLSDFEAKRPKTKKKRKEKKKAFISSLLWVKDFIRSYSPQWARDKVSSF